MRRRRDRRRWRRAWRSAAAAWTRQAASGTPCSTTISSARADLALGRLPATLGHRHLARAPRGRAPATSSRRNRRRDRPARGRAPRPRRGARSRSRRGAMTPGQRHAPDPVHQHALAAQPRIDRFEHLTRPIEIAQPEMREAEDDLAHQLAERVAGIARLGNRQLAQLARLLELTGLLVQPRHLEPEQQGQSTVAVAFRRVHRRLDQGPHVVPGSHVQQRPPMPEPAHQGVVGVRGRARELQAFLRGERRFGVLAAHRLHVHEPADVEAEQLHVARLACHRRRARAGFGILGDSSRSRSAARRRHSRRRARAAAASVIGRRSARSAARRQRCRSSHDSALAA